MCSPFSHTCATFLRLFRASGSPESTEKTSSPPFLRIQSPTADNAFRCSQPTTTTSLWFSGRGQLVWPQTTTPELLNGWLMLSMLALASRNCYHCVRIIIRTLNVLEKIESESGVEIVFDQLGGTDMFSDQPDALTSIMATLRPFKRCAGFWTSTKRWLQCFVRIESFECCLPSFESMDSLATNPSGKNCRSSLEGVWKFGYQNRFKFTGECTHPEANITACQIPGTQTRHRLSFYCHSIVTQQALNSSTWTSNSWWTTVSVRECRTRRTRRCSSSVWATGMSAKTITSRSSTQESRESKRNIVVLYVLLVCIDIDLTWLTSDYHLTHWFD